MDEPTDEDLRAVFRAALIEYLDYDMEALAYVDRALIEHVGFRALYNHGKVGN